MLSARKLLERVKVGIFFRFYTGEFDTITTQIAEKGCLGSSSATELPITRPGGMANQGWVEPEHFRQLPTECALANQAAALQTLDLHPGLLNERWEGEYFDVGNDRMYFREPRPFLLPAWAGARGLWSSC